MASGALAQIEEAGRLVRAAVSSIEAGAVSGGDAERLITALSSLSKSAEAGVAKLALRLEETARWKRAQAPSPEAHLGRLTGGSVTDGRRLLATSRRLDDLPATREAMESGRLSVNQAELIATAAGELAEAGRVAEAEQAEAELLEVASHGNFGSLRTAAEHVRQAARDEAAQAAHLRKTRFFRKRRFDDGGLGGTFKLEPGVAAQLYAVLDAETERQFAIARAEGRREGHEAYAADALIEVTNRGAALATAPTRACSDGDERDEDPKVATPPPRRVELIARVDVAALYRGHAMAGEVCEIAGVGAVPVDVIRGLLGEALLTLVLHDGVDVMNVTCAGRRGSRALRTAVLERAGHVCEVCGTPYGLELDHSDPLSLSGPTSYANLAPGCRVCHGRKSAAEAPDTIRAGRERAEHRRFARQRVSELLVGMGRRPLPLSERDRCEESRRRRTDSGRGGGGPPVVG